MEMVAAAKMRKAVEAALNTRTYAKMAWDLLVNLSSGEKEGVGLLNVRPVKRMLVILITGNRGLCGSFNSNIIKKTAMQLANPQNIGRQRMEGKVLEPAETIEIDVLGIGKKGAEFSKKMKYNLIASYTDLSDTPKLNDIMPVAKTAIADYEAGKYDKVVVAYTDFKSAIAQIAKLRQVLPVSKIDLEKMMAGDGERGKGKGESGTGDAAGRGTGDGGTPVASPSFQEGAQGGVAEVALNDYLFEPNRTEVLKIILPRLVETQIYQSLLESAASEHSSRMMAMRNASDAATDMIGELTMEFNKARQSKITQEIAEIVGGAAALE